MPIPFVHLHVHSDYSMLDATAKVGDLVKAAVKFGMPAIAVTDHGMMAASFDLMEACQKMAKEGKEIKPIYGCEFYVAPGSYLEKTIAREHYKGFHLVCLAETYEGYINMCHLCEEGWLKGYYHHPRVDKTLLRKYSKGIIAMSACLAGEVATYFKTGNDAKAIAAAEEYRDIFGEGNFFLELQNHGMEEDKIVIPKLLKLAKEKNFPLVCTNDTHYLTAEDGPAHKLFKCIGYKNKLGDPKMQYMGGGYVYYFKSPEEMAELFKDVPEALENTVKIAERCNVKLPLVADGVSHYPEFPLPPDYKGNQGNEGDLKKLRDEYLLGLCAKGMMNRYQIQICNEDGTYKKSEEFDEKQKIYVDRMYYELGIISRMGFTSYYLVVWDFLNWGHEHGVPLGPGRGSGAGSIVAYLIRITDIDPIRYNLLFERFLNPERVSPPDFDIDLCERRRHMVIEYVHERYGEGNVVQIGTYGTLKAKAVLKDVCRALGREPADGNWLAKMIPTNPKATLKLALEGDPKGAIETPDREKLAQAIQDIPWVQEAWSYAKRLEGVNRNMSMHAAGVIICDTRVSNVCPISRGADGEPTTQFPAHPDEELGLLKMDFLGLRNLTIIQDALDLIEKNTGRHLTPSDIPDDDPKAYSLLNRGETIGVFQLESTGMQNLCRRFNVNRLEDIIALIALFRPGPLQFLDEFIGRKQGTIPVVYEVPEMEPILKETYGIMLYQEQVMQVAQAVAGFTLGGADILRRAMGKKKQDVMDAMFEKFEKGAMAKGHSPDIIRVIWENIKKFAGYGFNKSHSAAYGLLSYRTAYLKANYPAEFLAAILSSELGNGAKMAFFLKECRRMGIKVLSPDVNICDSKFSADGPNIRFGLEAIRGVGENAVKSLVAAREKEGPFKDLDDFCLRVDGLSKKLLEALIKAGAMDCFGLHREQLMAMIDTALGNAQQRKKDEQVGQMSLFDVLTDAGGESMSKTPVPEVELWSEGERVGYEKELLGFYMTGHPIGTYRQQVSLYRSEELKNILDLPEGTAVRVGAFVTGVSIKTSKKDGRSFAILALEDADTQLECVFFAKSYAEMLEKNPSLFQEGQTVFIDGDISVKQKKKPVAPPPEKAEEVNSEGDITVDESAPVEPDEMQEEEAEEEEPNQFLGRAIYSVEEVCVQFTRKLQLRIQEENWNQEKTQRLSELFKINFGSLPVQLFVQMKDGREIMMNAVNGVQVDFELFHALEEFLGKENVFLQVTNTPAERPKHTYRRHWENE